MNERYTVEYIPGAGVYDVYDNESPRWVEKAELAAAMNKVITLMEELREGDIMRRRYLERIGELVKEKEALQQALAQVTAERDLYELQVQWGLTDGLFTGAQSDTI